MWIKRSRYNDLVETEKTFYEDNIERNKFITELYELKLPVKYPVGSIVFNFYVKSTGVSANYGGWYRWYELINIQTGDSDCYNEYRLDEFKICEEHTDKNGYIKKD